MSFTRIRRTRVAAAKITLFSAALAAVTLSGALPAAAQNLSALPTYVPDEVVVQFKEEATEAERDDVYRRAGVVAREHIFTRAMRRASAPGVVRLATRLPAAQALKALQRHPAVEFAEPNWIYTHQATPNDWGYTGNYLWGMYGDATSPANVYGSQVGEAWAAGRTGSAGVAVGIIDEGVDVSHPDLAANIWTNPREAAGLSGVDDDGNGYVDDINGWDFAANDNSVYDGPADDHGTHVAGTIGAVGNNNVGMVGMSWRVTMIPAKFLGANGGTSTASIRALDYLTDLKKRHGLNLVATNNSWGGGGYSQALHDAILRAAKANILFVAAAGNGGADGIGDNNDSVYAPNYPSNYTTSKGTTTQTTAGYEAVIAVAAIDRNGRLAGFSNYGATTVDLGAPGVDIASTMPNNTYGYMSGTSMASPHVAGAIALYAASNPVATAAQIRSAVLNSVVPTTSLSTRTATKGRLNASGF